MDFIRSVLVSHPSASDEITREIYGISGSSIAEDWILTHGSLLNPVISKSTRLRDFFSRLETGKIATLSSELSRDLQFHVIDKRSSSGDITDNDNNRNGKSPGKGKIVATWKCALLDKTLNSPLLNTWTFDKINDCDKLLLSTFLLIRVQSENENNENDSSLEDVKRVLSTFYRKHVTTLVPKKGYAVEIESTPFGNPVFIHSVSRGIISNIIGYRNCVILADANSVPGCEGGPVYVIHGSRRVICGMVIGPLSWCRGEWVDFTFAVNFEPCLHAILQDSPSFASLSEITELAVDGKGIIEDFQRVKIAEMIDRSVVVVKCGSGWGSGILIDKDTGTFLTCSHVVREAPDSRIKIEVQKPGRNSDTAPPTWARLVYRTIEDKPYDVAVLRADPREVDRSLRSISIGNTPIVEGEAVAIAGYPFFSKNLPTITRGNVSKFLECMLQTTCCVQSGTSGGPVLRWPTAEMLGMVVCNAISSKNSVLYPRLNMAIPVTILRDPLREYLKTGDIDALKVFSSGDKSVQRIWNFSAIPISKI